MKSSPRMRRSLIVTGLLALSVAVSAGPGLAQQGPRGPQSVSPVAEKLLDAVVNISTSQNVKGPQGVPLPRVPKGAPFEEYFNEFFDRSGRQGPDRKVSSLGSGFVISADGLIVTNNHVIEGADEIVINFADGSKLKVDKVVGRDTKTDLALLKVTPKKPLPFVPFGTSQRVKVGDWVLAIGNPFGFGGSVTLGIISAKQRDLNGPYDDYLQTDAAINKGNSGGPLFNMDGEVIGVNTAIVSPTGGSIGIGFAVPADIVMPVIEQLRQFGETRRGWLGVNIQSITEEIAESLGVKENSGALVGNVTPDGPAAKAGIETGDIIVRFDGKDVSAMRGLPRVVAQTPVGKTVDIELLRKGQKKSVRVVVGRLVEDGTNPDKPATPPAGGDKLITGLKLAVLDDALRAQHGIDKKVKQGVVVTEVDAASPAGQKGIRVGDVIQEASDVPVAGLDDIAKSIDRVKKAGRKALLLLVSDTKGDVRFIAVPIE